MISTIFHAVLYNPLLNALVLITSIMPTGDVGLAIVILTLVVKIILFPLSTKALETQAQMKALEPKLKEIKEKHKEDKTKQAELTMQLYKEAGMNPFSGILLTLIQLPILIALYLVFSKGLPVNPTQLYSFVHIPENLHFTFLGLVDLAKPNYLMAALSGVLQFIQMQLAVPPIKKKTDGESTMSDEFARSMNMNMRYVMPVMIAVIGFKLPAAIVVYWITNNLFMIGHELYRRRKALAAG